MTHFAPANGAAKERQGLSRENLESIRRLRDEFRSREFASAVGGDFVRVTVNGAGEVLRVEITPEALEVADRVAIENLVVKSTNEAGRKARDAMRDELIRITYSLEGVELGSVVDRRPGPFEDPLVQIFDLLSSLP